MSAMKSNTQNLPLVVFGEDWGGHPTSTQHIVKQLMLTRKVIWINSIGLRQPKFTLRDANRVIAKLSAFLLKKDKVDKSKDNEHCIDKNMTVINPLVVPCATSLITLTISRWLLARQLKKAMVKLEVSKANVWCSLPTAVDYLSVLPDSHCVYYCGDDFGSLAGVDHDVVLSKEQRLIKKVKYIFTAGKELLAKFPKDKAVTVSHGVNFNLFNEKRNCCPSELPNNGPIAGFYGSVSTWLDQELILEAASDLPHWSFVFIGNIETNIDKLRNISNIHFLGAKPHAELPNYIQHWDVAMLPFKDNEQIRMCNPLKLREYLASGTPIVSTNFNALREYKNHVMVVDENTNISKALLLAKGGFTQNTDVLEVEALDELWKLTQCKQRRVESVLSETWESRASQVEEYLMRS